MADVNGEEQEENFRYEDEEDFNVFRDSSKNSENLIDDTELEALKIRMKEIEDEAEVLRHMQSEVEKQFGGGTDASPPQLTIPSLEEQIEIDGRSIYIGNVDYSATAEDLEAHFHGCGSVNRVTILSDRYTGHPKGYAYMEFAEKSCVQLAMQLSDTLFHGRQIVVSPKRTNKPGMGTTNRSMRGRGRGGPRVIVKYVYGGPHRSNQAYPPK